MASTHRNLHEPLTIGLANVHGRVAPLRTLASYPKVCSWGLSEAYPRPVTRALAVWSGYRAFYGMGGRDRRRGAKDVPILTRRTHSSLGTLALQASEQTTPERIAPDRWITVSMFDHPQGRIGHVNIHPNAAVKNLGANVPRVREYSEMMESLSRTLSWLRSEGFLRVLTGDVNFPRGAQSPDWLDVYEVLEAHAMPAQARGIDLIAHDEMLRPAGELVVIPARQLGSDHPGLIGTYARVNQKYVDARAHRVRAHRERNGA